MIREGVVEKETMDVLRADDILTRVYKNDAIHGGASLFIAYFKRQRAGQFRTRRRTAYREPVGSRNRTAPSIFRWDRATCT